MTLTDIMQTLRDDADVARSFRATMIRKPQDIDTKNRIAVWYWHPHAGQKNGKYVGGWLCESVTGYRLATVVAGEWWWHVHRGRHWPAYTNERAAIARATAALEHEGWTVHPPDWSTGNNHNTRKSA